MAISKIGSDALASGVPSRSQLPAGTVLQVVSSNYTTYPTSTTSTSFVTTGHTVSITPTSASSKILLMAVTSTLTTGSLGANTGYFTFARNGTNLVGNTYGLVEQGSGFWSPTSFQYLDSPSTTSTITYSVYFKNTGSATTYWVGNAGEYAVLTAMEIAA